MAQSIILKRSALQGKVPTTSSLNVGELAINTYDGKIYLNRSGSSQSIQEVVTTNVVNTGSITITRTGSFGELVVSQDGNFQRDLYVTQDIISNGNLDILYDVTASAFLGAIRATNGVISSSAQLTLLNSFTASAGIRLTNLETTSASLLIETQNLELFSASALNRLTNLETTTSSLNSSVSQINLVTASLNSKTASYATTGSNTFRGNQIVSGSITTSGSVSIVASGSNVFTVDGTSGRLFSIDDSLSGSLFSVNTAAGLPVIEAFSDNTIRIGQFGQRALFVSQSRVGIGKELGLNATLDVSGSAIFSGSLSVSGQFTASLQTGYIWVGDANGLNRLVPTSSFAITTSGSASFVVSAISSSYPFRATASGNVSIYSSDAGQGTNNDFSYFIGYKAGLSASNSTYSTYIGDFAGAIDNGSSTYSHAGVMIGSDAGYNANNSFLGVYIGNRAGMNATNASQSVFIGTQAGESGSQAANSVMVGSSAGVFASQSRGAVFVGESAGARAAGAYETVAIGYAAAAGVSTTYASNAFRSVFIGSSTAGGATNASNTVFIGYGSGQLATNASSSVFIGNQAGVSNSNASFSNFIGYKAGFNGGSLLGANNTIIGTNITLPAGYSNYANIGAVLFISGTYSTTTGNPTQAASNGKVGINVINPTLGMLQVGGNVYADSFTGSLFGTASWANNVVSASFASTSSFTLRGLVTASVAGATITFTKGDNTTFDLTIAQSGTVATASYVTSSGVFGPFGSNSILTASYATTASYVENAVSASFAPNYVLNSRTSSFATTGSNSFVGNQIITGSLILSGSSSTTLLSTNADTILITGSAIITGSVVVTGSVNATNFTGSLFGTASWAINALTASNVSTASLVNSFFVQGGNSFGTTALIGTNDSQSLAFETSGSVRMFISGSGNIGVGTITPSASLHILGTNTADTYSLWVQNSSGQTLISAQNNRTVNINNTNTVDGNTFIGTTNGTINFNQGYNNQLIGNALTFYSGGPASTIQGFNSSPGIAIGYAGTTVNPNPGTGLSIRGTTTTSGSAVLFVTGSSTTRLLALASETNPNAFVVSGSGNVGIGTSTPTAALFIERNHNNVTGIVISNNNAGIGANPYLQLLSDATAGQGQVFKYSSGRTPYKTIAASDFGHYNATAGDISFLNDVTTGNIKFAAGGSSTPQMFISSSGNVGIGTNTPNALLHLTSSTSNNLFEIDTPTQNNILLVSSSGVVSIGMAGAAYGSTGTNNGKLTINNTSGNNGLAIRNGETGYQLAIKTTTNDGIGTEFVWYDGNTITFLQYGGSIGARLGSSGVAQFRSNNADTSATIHTGASTLERLRVTSTGLVGIGTTTPNARLDVSGSAIISGSLIVTQGITGSLSGTASWATNALTTSYANNGFRITNSEFHNTSSLTTSGTTTISQLATGSYISAFYNYSIISASNARAGQIMSIWSGSTATYTEVTTTDIGNTSAASFAVNVVGSNVQLNFTATGTWTVRTIANLL